MQDLFVAGLLGFVLALIVMRPVSKKSSKSSVQNTEEEDRSIQNLCNKCLPHGNIEPKNRTLVQNPGKRGSYTIKVAEDYAVPKEPINKLIEDLWDTTDRTH